MTNAFSSLLIGDGIHGLQTLSKLKVGNISSKKSRKLLMLVLGAVVASVVGGRIYHNHSHPNANANANSNAKTKGKGEDDTLRATTAQSNTNINPRKQLQVDAKFINTLFTFCKICVPGFLSKEFRMLVSVAVLLIFRSYLDIWTSDNGGQVVSAIVGKDKEEFLRRAVRDLLLMMFPIALVNNLLRYSISRLKTMMRKRLSMYFHDLYLKSNTFYRVSNLDKRLPNIDQLLTTDIEKFTSSIADLYSNLSKPILDIVLFSNRLSKSLGPSGPVLMIAYFAVASGILRAVQPAFGKMTADEQRLEGEYRLHHSRLIAHSEEIAFYRGGNREKQYINEAFDRVVNHLHKIFGSRFYIGLLDSILVKYIATVAGYCIVSIPIFFSSSFSFSFGSQLAAKVASRTQVPATEENASSVAGVYTRNSRLLISLAGAIGRLVLAAKEITRLTGYCSRVADLDTVLHEMIDKQNPETIARSASSAALCTIDSASALATAPTIDSIEPISVQQQQQLQQQQRNGEEWGDILDLMGPGELIIGGDQMVKFSGVNIISPDRIVLCRNLTLEIYRGMNVLITGPNGCGKSSTFRVLAGIWPLYGGSLTRPRSDRLFYVPQKPYLAIGSLRENLVYPLLWSEAVERHHATDEQLWQLLTEVHLKSVAVRKGGLDAEMDWSEVLSGGEKQRLAMARLFFHCPAFAVLDECTSAVSLDVEGFLYTRAKELGISLITVSHRPSLWRFHEKVLKFDGHSGYEFRDIKTEDIPTLTFSVGETHKLHTPSVTEDCLSTSTSADDDDDEYSLDSGQTTPTEYDWDSEQGHGSDLDDGNVSVPSRSPHRNRSFLDLEDAAIEMVIEKAIEDVAVNSPERVVKGHHEHGSHSGV